MAVPSLSQQNSRGAQLSHHQLSLKRERGDKRIPSPKIEGSVGGTLTFLSGH